jgi:hypothetical protein
MPPTRRPWLFGLYLLNVTTRCNKAGTGAQFGNTREPEFSRLCFSPRYAGIGPERKALCGVAFRSQVLSFAAACCRKTRSTFAHDALGNSRLQLRHDPRAKWIQQNSHDRASRAGMGHAEAIRTYRPAPTIRAADAMPSDRPKPWAWLDAWERSCAVRGGPAIWPIP